MNWKKRYAWIKYELKAPSRWITRIIIEAIIFAIALKIVFVYG